MWIIICFCIWSKCLYKNQIHPIAAFIFRAWKVKGKGHLVQFISRVRVLYDDQHMLEMLSYAPCSGTPSSPGWSTAWRSPWARVSRPALRPGQEPEDHRSWRDTRRNTRSSPPQQTSAGGPEPELRPETRRRTASRPDTHTQTDLAWFCSAFLFVWQKVQKKEIMPEFSNNMREVNDHYFSTNKAEKRYLH